MSARKIQLTKVQAEAYAKLREGILAVANLDAIDSNILQEWLSQSFGGPIGEHGIVFDVAHAVLREIDGYDDRQYPDDCDWDQMVVAACAR